eukprot:2951059-Amphidinium_carterae.1
MDNQLKEYEMKAHLERRAYLERKDEPSSSASGTQPPLPCSASAAGTSDPVIGAGNPFKKKNTRPANRIRTA